MNFRFILGILLLALAACAAPPKAVQLEQANVLPLDINANFEIRKIKYFYYEPRILMNSRNETITFERRRTLWGAIESYEEGQRFGNYYDIFWRTQETADVTVRLEYRQTGLGNLVKAKELYYPDARGSYKSSFSVTGDEYIEFGRVSMWRVVLIVNGRIVALRQSFAWK